MSIHEEHYGPVEERKGSAVLHDTIDKAGQEAAQKEAAAIEAMGKEGNWLPEQKGKDAAIPTNGSPAKTDGVVIRTPKDLDRDGNKTVTKKEADESAQSLTDIVSKMPAAAKKEFLKEYAAKQKADPDGRQEAADYEKNTGIKMDPEAALAAREAKVAGAKLPNPDSAIAAQEAEEEKKLAGKDGKKGKNLLEMIIAIVMKFLGVEEKNEETAVADAKDKAPTGQEQQSAAKGKEPELTPEEKQKSVAYLKELGDDFQKSIAAAGLSGSGVKLNDAPQMVVQVQTGAKLKTAETTVKI